MVETVAAPDAASTRLGTLRSYIVELIMYLNSDLDVFDRVNFPFCLFAFFHGPPLFVSPF